MNSIRFQKDGFNRAPGALYCLILLCCSAIAQTTAQSPSNSITGLVTDSGRNPVQQIRVELLDEVNAMMATTRTDSIGRFRFAGLSQGNFQVRVVTAGTSFVETSIAVQLRYSRGSTGAHHEQIEIMLRTREEAKGPANYNAGTTFAQEVPERARKAFERGVSLLSNGNDEAGGLNALLEAVDIFPEYYLALERLGAELVRFQEYEKARIALVKAVEVNSSGPLSRYALGVADYHLRLYPEAIEHLRRAVSLAPASPNTPVAQYYLGLCYLKKERPADAEAQFKRACEAGKGRVPSDVHMHLAQIYSNQKRYREAADELEIFLKETPDARDAESIRGLIAQLRAKAK